MRVYPEGEFQIITLCRGETFFGFESDKEEKRLLLGPKMLHRQIGWTVWIDGSQTITDSHGCRIFTAKGGVGESAEQREVPEHRRRFAVFIRQYLARYCHKHVDSWKIGKQTNEIIIK